MRKDDKKRARWTTRALVLIPVRPCSAPPGSLPTPGLQEALPTVPGLPVVHFRVGRPVLDHPRCRAHRSPLRRPNLVVGNEFVKATGRPGTCSVFRAHITCITHSLVLHVSSASLGLVHRTRHRKLGQYGFRYQSVGRPQSQHRCRECRRPQSYDSRPTSGGRVRGIAWWAPLAPATSTRYIGGRMMPDLFGQSVCVEPLSPDELSTAWATRFVLERSLPPRRKFRRLG